MNGLLEKLFEKRDVSIVSQWCDGGGGNSSLWDLGFNIFNAELVCTIGLLLYFTKSIPP
jgi:hypothetical protein